MKTTIGGDRLGSGSKQEISKKNFERSTHDLSSKWRSSMAAGTLVPFMNLVALPGDSFDIDLTAEVVTLPTIGPLFGSYKVQLDVFEVPYRLYNAGLQMNRLGVGNDMSTAYLPTLNVYAQNHAESELTNADNEQINASCIYKYLGVSGIGSLNEETEEVCIRAFNAIPYLGYWEIFKQYYSNKQETNAYVVHTAAQSELKLASAKVYTANVLDGDMLTSGEEGVQVVEPQLSTQIKFVLDATTVYSPDPNYITVEYNGDTVTLTELFATTQWLTDNELVCSGFLGTVGLNCTLAYLSMTLPVNYGGASEIKLKSFRLSNIDKMREKILQHPFDSGAFNISNQFQPYTLPHVTNGSGPNTTRSCQYTQEGLAVKTYQSDLFNNWIDTEWIDGTNGVNAVTAISTTGDSFTLDTLNLASKVYNMLNRIAVSGGTYDDWLDAVYAHDRSKQKSSPVYHGSLIKELQFEEVISQAETQDGLNTNPLGTLAGTGRLNQKNKGGYIKINVDEPSQIIGIISLTPKISYSQGNDWSVNLKTFDDLHKPHLDAIGFQDLITEQMSHTDTTFSADGEHEFRSAGKTPAWINYMTDVDKVYGNFAEANKEGYMVLNRNYDIAEDGRIEDLTTYIDPAKFNNIFAQTDLSAQNFWVHIGKKITARRKMSAKVIPNL